MSQFLLCRRGLILISLQRQQSRHSKSATNSSSLSVASARKGRDTCLRFEADNSVELDQDAWFAIPVPKGRIIYSRTIFQPFTFEFADLLLALGIIIWSSLFVISRYFCHGGNEKRTICNMICLSGTATLTLHCVVWFPPSPKQVSDITFLRPTPQTCTQPPPCGLVPDQQVCRGSVF